MGLGLHLVTVEITGRCNLSCSHCYRESDEHEDLVGFDLLLNQLAEIKPYYITVSGGEPLLLKDVFYLAKELKNVCQKLLLTTNGILVRKFPGIIFVFLMTYRSAWMVTGTLMKRLEALVPLKKQWMQFAISAGLYRFLYSAL